MLYPDKVLKALEARLPEFRQFEARHVRDMESYLLWLERLGGMSREEIEAAAGGWTDPSGPGALPSDEHGSPILVRFPQQWTNHQEAREWAFRRILGITTLAVDGSQIPPSKDYSIGLAALQIAWFENPHRVDAQGYVKDARFELLPPKMQRESGEEGTQLTQEVNLRRFEAEVDEIVGHLQGWGQGGDRPPVAFFDGSLAVSFAASLPEEMRHRYVGAILRLLAASSHYRVPVVGFVDTSHAKDLCNLLAHLGGLPKPDRINDAHLLRGRMNWGDRTRAFICARDHILRYYRYNVEGGEDFSREVAFLYLQTTGDAPPARLDIPAWVVRDRLVDYVADVVRCEVIVGTGYPYCLEAVDAAAVLSVPDREAFYAQVQAFCERNGMQLRLAPKAASKRRRRV